MKLADFFIGLRDEQIKEYISNHESFLTAIKDYAQESSFESALQLMQLSHLLDTYNILKDIASKKHTHESLVELLDGAINRYEKAGISPLTYSYFLSVFLNVFAYSENVIDWPNPFQYTNHQLDQTKFSQLGFGTNIEKIDDFEITDGVLNNYKGDKSLIYIPNTVKKIGDYAFEGQTFKAVVIPNSIKTIGSFAFKDCKNLENILYESPITNLAEGVFKGCSSLNHYPYFNQTVSVGPEAFVGTSIEEINDESFSNPDVFSSVVSQCDNLKNLTISSPKNFSNMKGNIKSRSVTLMPQIDLVHAHAFQNSVIGTLIFQAQEIDLKPGAFLNASIQMMEASSQTLEIKDRNFVIQKNDLIYVLSHDADHLTIPESIHSIAEGAISNHNELKSITFNSELLHIQKNAITQCPNLKSFTIKNESLEIYKSIHATCELIKTLKIEQKTTSLIADVFPNLETLNIAKDASVISTQQFARLEHLSEFSSETVTQVKDLAFYGCKSLKKVSLPNASRLGFGIYAGCEQLEYVEFSLNNEPSSQKFSPLALGSYFNLEPANGFHKVTQFVENTYRDYYLPESLKTVKTHGSHVSNGFLSGLRGLDLIFVDAVDKIEHHAFMGSDIRNIQLADGATLEASAFKDCDKLTVVHNLKNASSIKADVFENCHSLTEIVVAEPIFDLNVDQLITLKNLETLQITPAASSNYEVRDNFLIDKITKEILFVPPKYNPETLAISKVQTVSKGIFTHMNRLHTLEIKNVDEIKEYAFEPLQQLKNLFIRGDIKSIGQKILNQITALETLELPYVGSSETEPHLGEFGEFYSDKPLANLQKISIQKGLLDQVVFKGLSFLKELNYLGPECTVAPYAFSHLNNLETVHFEESNLVLGAKAFQFCQKLDVQSIIESAKTIGPACFEGCENLSTLHITEHVESIGANAFKGCKNLRQLTIDSSNIQIEDNAFNTEAPIDDLKIHGHIDILRNIFGPELNIKNLKIDADRIPSFFMNNNAFIQNVYLSGSYENVAERAFNQCVNLKQVSLNDAAKSIDESAFEGCVNLKYIEGLDAITKVEKSAFSGCNALESIIMPSVQVIEASSFSNCTNLQEVHTAEALKEIHEAAFYNNSQLKTTGIMINLKYLGPSAFQNCESVTEINLGKVKEIHSNTFDACQQLTQVHIPYTCEFIHSYAFDSCPSLKQLFIPASVQFVDEFAFYHSNEHLTLVMDNKKQAKQFHKYWNYKHDDILSESNPIKKIKLNLTDRFKVVNRVNH